MNVVFDQAVTENLESYGDSIESFEKFILDLTESLREMIESGFQETSRLELAENERAREATDKMLKSWDKAESARVWGTVAKVFGFAIVALTMATPLVCLTPMTAAMAMTTLVSLAASPLIEKGFAKLAEELGPVAGPIVGLLVMAALLLVACRGCASGVSKMSAKAMTMPNVSTAISNLKSAFLNASKGGLSTQQLNAVQAFCDKLNYSMLGVQSGAQLATSTFRFQAQKLMADADLTKSDMQDILSLIDALMDETQLNKQQHDAAIDMLSTIYTPAPKF